MKKVIALTSFIVFVLVIYTIPVFAGQTDGKTCELVVHIKGFDHSGGMAKVALVNSKENFSAKIPYKGFNFKIVDRFVNQIIVLPYGEYALKVYHDENENNEMDRHMLGMPLEPYGFSNNVKGSFGPPNYEAALFTVDSAGKEIIINLN